MHRVCIVQVDMVQTGRRARIHRGEAKVAGLA